MAQERNRHQSGGKRSPGPVKAVLAAAACLAALAVVATVATAPQAVSVERAEETVAETPVAQAEEADKTGTGPTASEPTGPTASEPSEEPAGPAAVTVHVDGAVASPGVYVVRVADARVADAVDAAGGLAQGADTAQLNLAARLDDGAKVHVPAEGEAAPAPVQPAGATAQPSQGAAGPVNINSASADELCALPGVGQATAAAIVEDREANGPFSSIEDLMRVSGIGEKKFAKLKGSICV